MLTPDELIGTRWRHRHPDHRLYRGQPVVYEVTRAAPRVKAWDGLPMMRWRNVNRPGSQEHLIHPHVIQEVYERVDHIKGL